MPNKRRREMNFETFLHHNVKPKTVFVDVGANVGRFVRLAARTIRHDSGGAIHAFEPDLRAGIDILNMRLTLAKGNPDAARAIRLYNFPLTNMAGVTPFSVGDNTQLSSTYPRTMDTGYGMTYHNSVTLSDVVNDGFDILKVDTEGAEYEVLMGARDLLLNQRKRPMAILIETCPRKQADTGKVLDLLDKHGFRREWMQNGQGRRPTTDDSDNQQHIIAVNNPEFFVMPFTKRRL